MITSTRVNASQYSAVAASWCSTLPNGLLPTPSRQIPGTAVGGPYTNGAGRAKPWRRDRADGGPPRARELRPGAEPLPPQCGGRRTTATARTISAQKSAHGSANMCYPRPRQPYVRICAWDRWKVRRSRRSNSWHEKLRAAGVESHYSVYTGGHDYAWWRGALIGRITSTAPIKLHLPKRNNIRCMVASTTTSAIAWRYF
ncbi:enterochelin esterase [Salmonella enterica subsp. enterica]|uniref:Enterochelin esterase n=1 Tax=Salmonella enterica I TaxID=59201 RepID=A0A3S4K7S1_SALET|nr:enterochelin esterase [Salmonella enterica subsp. enterica]